MLSFTLLGQASVWHDGVPLSGFRSKKELALLFYLAHSGRPHTREHLADLLWENRTTPQALRNLRTVLSRTRKHVGDALIATRDCIALAPHCIAHVDSRAVLEVSACATGQVADNAPARLRKSLQCYGGAFLESFTLRHAPAFDRWVQHTQEDIRQHLTSAYQTLVTHMYAQGNFAQALHDVRNWLKVDTWDERAHLFLVRLLYESGREGEAFDHYQRWRQRFRAELGVELSSAFVEPFEAPSTTPPRKHLPLARRNHNLPAVYDSFWGRVEIQQEIHARLAQPWCRLVTIAGHAGVGKTRLALTIAHAAHPRYADGAWWVSLEELEHDDPDASEAIAVEIASTLSLPLAGGGTCLQQLQRYLQGKQMLLVLDAFEHLRATGKTSIARLLEKCDQVQILVTSREPLNMRGENVFHLRGLQHPNMAADAETSNAVALFVARCAQQRWQPLSEDELVCVRRICDRVEGLPLAIELAARLTRHMSVHEIEAQLRQGFDILETAFPGALSRRTSLRYAFEETWALLSPTLQQTLARLAVCEGGFTSAAAQTIAHATFDQLAALCDASLLRCEFATHRYALSPIIQAFVRELVPLDETVVHTHARYYLAQLAQLPVPLPTEGQKRVPANLNADGQNFQRAWQTALAQQWLDELSEAFAAFVAYLDSGVPPHDVAAIMRMTSQQANQWGYAGVALALRAELIYARTHILAGGYAQAIQTLEHALQRAQQHQMAWAEGAGYALWGLALALNQQQDMAASKLASARRIEKELYDEQSRQWYHEIVAFVENR